MRFFSKCDACKKRRFFVRRRSVYIKNLGQRATSHLEICNACKNRVEGAVNTKK